MAWVYLGLAAVFEIVFAVSMKQSNGFTKLWPTVLVVIGVIGGISLLTIALKTLPVSVGYPVWVGVGTVGTVLFGAVVLGETMSVVTVASIAAILLGVIGLKVSVGDGTAPSPSDVAAHEPVLPDQAG